MSATDSLVESGLWRDQHRRDSDLKSQRPAPKHHQGERAAETNRDFRRLTTRKSHGSPPRVNRERHFPERLCTSPRGPTRGPPLHPHPLLPLPRPAPIRLRGVRRPFTPRSAAGPYRLPHEVRDRLTSALAPYRNRDAAFALAVFLGRFWSTPARVL